MCKIPLDKRKNAQKSRCILVFGVKLMKTSVLYLEIVRYIHYIIFSDYYIRRATKRQMDFTRNRKMSFTDYIFAIIKGTKTSLQSSIDTFFESQHKNHIEYSKQAFSKGRQRIKPEAFEELFLAVAERFYQTAETNKWRGYHLFGIDGTRLNLPCTQELEEIYDSQTSQGAPQVQALVSCLYDLLNGMIVDTRFCGCKSSERDAAGEMIEAFHADKYGKPVFIMDRGYPSAELIHSIMQAGHKYVMRCSTEFLRSMKLPKRDNIIEHKFAKLKEKVKIRVVKVAISDEDTEYLVTNLFDADLSERDFGDLYHTRWGIETKYNDIKNKLEIENFTGYSPDAILQDFYATMFLANLAGVLEFDLHEEIEAAHNSPEHKYQYKLNKNRTISELKRTVVEMIATRSKVKRMKLFLEIKNRLHDAVVPVRPNRTAPRTKRHKSARFSQNIKRP